MKSSKIRRLDTSTSCKARRSNRGLYMIELLIALATSAMLAAALVENMATTDRLSNSGENQIIAATVAQLLVDNTRNRSYASLVPGTYTWHIPWQAGDSTLFATPSRPLQDASSKFEGMATEQISNGTGLYVNTIQVDISVTWNEGPTPHQYSLTTRISPNGIHN